MTSQPTHTDTLNTHGTLDSTPEDLTSTLLTLTAQQAVLPRHLDEGIYAVLDAEGGIQIRETDGYAQKRKFDWEQAHSDKPEFVHRNVTVLDVDSFIDYLDRNYDEHGAGGNRHAAGELELWADIDARTIKAILDGITGLRKNTATLVLKTSREWDEWAAIDGKFIEQDGFAQFIEDHMSTIAEPEGAKLMEICQTLEGTKGAVYKQETILATGQRTFKWEEAVEGKAGKRGDLTIPGELVLVLKPFQGADPVPVIARFRYRPDPTGMRLGVKLAEPEKALEDAFAVIVAAVDDQTPVRVNHGRG